MPKGKQHFLLEAAAMMNTNNTYFDNLYRLGCEYEAARAERQTRKQQIIDTRDWDSAELKAW